MLSRWHAARVAPVLARVGSSWPIGPTPGGLALLAHRWATSLAGWPAGLAHLGLRTHPDVFVALWVALLLLGLCPDPRPRQRSSGRRRRATQLATAAIKRRLPPRLSALASSGVLLPLCRGSNHDFG